MLHTILLTFTPSIMIMYITPYLFLGLTTLVSLLAFLDPTLRDSLMGHPYSVHYQREWYRLLSAGFLHADLPHLFFNLYGLQTFSPMVVRYLAWNRSNLWGEAWFGILYLGAILVANGISYYFHRYDPLYFQVGASAGVVAVMAAAIFLEPTIEIGVILLPISLPGALFLPLYLLVSFALSGTATRIDHLSHFIGGIYGVGLMALLYLLDEV